MSSAMRTSLAVLAILLAATSARADDALPDAGRASEVDGSAEPQVAAPASLATPAAPAERATPAPEPPAYSLPWQLRAISPSTGFRSDSTYARYEDSAGSGGSTVVTFLSACYTVSSKLGVFGRAGFASDSPPASTNAQAGTVIANPMLGAVLAFPVGAGFKVASSLVVSIPDGDGGSNTGSTAQRAAFRARNQANLLK